MITDIASKIRLLFEDIESCLAEIVRWEFEDLERKIDSITQEYKLVKHEARTSSETGKCLLGFVQNKGDYIKNSDCLEDITRRSWTSIQCGHNELQDISDKIQVLSSAYYLEKGKYHYTNTRIEEALDMWEEVLKTDPANEFVHFKVDEIIELFEVGNSIP